MAFPIRISRPQDTGPAVLDAAVDAPGHDTASVSRDAADLSLDRLAVGTRDNLAGAAVERAFGLVLTLTLPLLLTSASLGAYYEVTALVTILLIVSTAGLDTGVTRFTALAAERGRPHLIPAYVRTALAWSIPIGMASAALLAWSAPTLARAFGEPSLRDAFVLAGLAIPAMAAAFVLVAPSRGLKRMGPWVVAVQVVQPGVQLGVAVLLVVVGFGLVGAVGGLVASAAAACLVAAVAYRRRFGGIARRATGRRAVTGELLRFSAPVAGMTLAGTSLLWLDTLLLGLYRSPADVAAYGLVVRLLMVDVAVLFAVIQILGPFVTQFVERGDRDGLGAVLRTATRWVLWLSAPLLTLMALLGTRILGMLHQRADGVGAAILILCAAFLVDAITGPVGHVLTMAGRSGLNLVNNTVALVCNVGLNLLLIPPLGITGAAIAWAVVIVGVNVARLIQVRRAFAVTPFSRSLGAPLVSALVGGCAGAAVLVVTDRAGAAGSPWSTALAAASLAIAFILTAIALGLEPADRAALRTVRIGSARAR